MRSNVGGQHPVGAGQDAEAVSAAMATDRHATPMALHSIIFSQQAIVRFLAGSPVELENPEDEPTVSSIYRSTASNQLSVAFTTQKGNLIDLLPFGPTS